MAIPSFTGLETALRGLTAAQAAIDTTGQNIANANNPGYSRQTAVLAESYSLDLPAFSNTTGHGVQLGTGVDVTTINRVRDQFLDVQYRAQNSATSGLQTASGLLQQVQTALAEPSTDGVTSQLTAFWNSWSNLANAPTSLAAKQGVVDSATTLADTFNGIDSQLQTIQSQADAQYTSLTSSSGQIQSDANQIAALNGEINQALGAGQSPNSLLDQRDQLLDNLSQYGTVSVNDPGNGLLVVNFGGDMSTPLINGKSANSVSSLTLGPSSGGTIGTLAGLISPTGQISGYLSTLNQFATTLANSVNAIHTATPFFAVNTSTTSLGATATTLSVAVAPANVQTTTTSNPGTNDVAMAIAGLAGGATDQNYSAFVSQVGSDVQSNQSNLTTANTLLSSINSQRESVSGVSLDEEMTNLITYQRAYEASARMMNTINSTLDTIINQVGAGL
jgi:flagellar hook-associated protein 1